MPEPTKLQAQTTAEDAALLGVGAKDSIFRKKGHYAVSDFAFQEKQGTSNNGATQSGQEVVFEIDKEGTLLKDVTLCFTAPALTGLVTGSPTYARYPDFGGLQLLSMEQPITYSYGSNKIMQVHPDQIYVDYRYSTDEERVTMEGLLKGNLTPAQRNTLALNPVQFRVPLPKPWEGDGNELKICALANKLKITFRFASAAQAIQTDGTKPATLTYSDIYLRYELGHTTGSEREELAAPTFMGEGVYTLFSDVAKYDHAIPLNALNTANALGFVVPLNYFTGPVRRLVGLLREQTAMDISQPAPAFYDINTTYLDDLTFQVKANDKTLFELSRPNHEQVEHLKRYYNCRPDVDSFYIWWDYDPKNLFCASGHTSLANFTNPRLHLKKTTNHPALICTLLSFTWNWTSHMNGVYQSIWK